MSENEATDEDVQLFKQIARLRYTKEYGSPETRKTKGELFDRMIARVESAAEQRGAARAVKAIRKLADENRGYEWLHPEDHLNELADWLEGDE